MRRSTIAWTAAILVALTLTTTGCDTSRNAALAKVAEGMNAVSGNDYSRAVEAFEDSIAINGDIAEAHYYIGLIRLQQYNDANGAIRAFELALEAEFERDSLLPEVHYQFGVALEQLERLDPAKEQFRLAIEADPEHARALYRLGTIVEAEEEIRDAIDYYTRSIYADPRFPFAYNALGNIYLRYGRPQEAIQVFQNAIENNPNDLQNRADVARVYMTLEDFDSAISYLRPAAEASGSSLAVQFNLGVALRARYQRNQNPADRDAAIDWLTRARNRCNPAEEQARCDSIAGAMRELENPDPPGEE